MYPWYPPRDTAEVQQPQVCANGPQSSGSPSSATSPAIKSENGSAYGDCMDYALHAKLLRVPDYFPDFPPPTVWLIHGATLDSVEYPDRDFSRFFPSSKYNKLYRRNDTRHCTSG
ncbi:Hypothetical protein CINCED_3A024557 [Cinara cedri]|uniref:Uncharacterized protein n=1 Tax=Cinara cedri TaxID=506608 RepID=A0A5E4M3N0_9HEMI|nr:Hypothetical protein CINCED_3A024557 [Cinara cedri]